MKSYIALLGLVASAHALESSYPPCTISSVYHATILSTKASTVTFTSIPTNVNHGSGQDAGSLISITATVIQASTTTGSTRSTGDGIATTPLPVDSSSSSITSDRNLDTTSGSQAQTHGSATPSANDGSSNTDSSSSFSSSTTPVGALSTSQPKTQSPYIPSTTMAIFSVTPSRNSTSPKSSLVAFTGSSTPTSISGGVMMVGLLFTMILL